MEIISKKRAKELGYKYYYTGKPCKYGHDCPRFTSCGECINCRAEYSKIWRNKNKERNCELAKQWQRNNPQKTKEMRKKSHKKWRENYPEKDRQNRKKWFNKNKDYVNKKRKEKRKYDLSFQMSTQLGNMLRRVLYRLDIEKFGDSEQILGYNKFDLIEHLEKQFRKGMTWENFGSKWHIDHIKPISVYIEEGETRPEVINALENLQPLWAEENLKKGSTYSSESSSS